MTTANESPDFQSPSLPSATRWRYRLLAVSFPIAWALGTMGYLQYMHGPEPATFSNALYHAAQLFLLHAPHFEGSIPWTLEAGRWLAAVSTGWVLIETALRLLRVETSNLRLRCMKHHVVVCGLGQRGMTLIEQLHEQHKPVVAVEKAPAPEAIERLRELDVLLVTGDASRPEVLRQARLERADTLYALCDEDAINCEIAFRAADIAPRFDGGRRCFVHISNTELRTALRSPSPPSEGCRNTMMFVDAFDPQALNLLVHGLPLDHDGIAPDDPRRAHLVILGFGRMGRALAVRAAQLGHFANGSRVRISVIDRKADVHRAALLFHYPHIQNVVDLDFHPHEAISPEARALVEEWCRDPNTLTSLVIGFDQETAALDLALQLRPVFAETGARVAVRMPGQGGLARMLGQEQSEQKAQIHTFGLDEQFANLANPEEEPTEKFARDIHGFYVKERFRQAADDPGAVAKLKDAPELQGWEDLLEDFRESNRQQAAHLHFKLRALGLEAVPKDDQPGLQAFTADQVELLSTMEHNRWIAERRMAGWVYGVPSDKPRRINANLVPWDQLTESTKDYDRNTVRAIPALLNSVGKMMCLRSQA